MGADIKNDLTVGDFSKLTTTLFSAALGQVEWEDFLSELSAYSGDICTHLIGFDSEAGLAIDFATVGYDPEYLKTYDQHFASLNAWAPGFAVQPSGVSVDCEVMCPTEKLIKTEFYHEWLRPQEDIIQGGGAVLFKSSTRVFALGGNIRQKDSDRLKGNWLRLVDQLIPHMQQAFEVSRALAGAKLETAIVAREGLREVPAVFMLSEIGRIIYANSVAQNMLVKGTPVGSDIQGNLTFGRHHRTFGRKADLDLLLHRLNSVNPSFSMILEDGGGGSSFALRFVKLTPEAQIAYPLDATLGFSSRCTLLIISEQRSTSTLFEILQIKHGLTEAEAEVSLLLVEGLTSREISDRRQSSIHTVRHQIKAAMAKLEVHRQVELVRTLNSMTSHSPFR